MSWTAEARHSGMRLDVYRTNRIIDSKTDPCDAHADDVLWMTPLGKSTVSAL